MADGVDYVNGNGKLSDRVKSLCEWVDAAKNWRSNYEPQWYVNRNAYENNHFTVWLPKKKMVATVPIKGSKFFNQIPEIKKQVDTVENMLLSNDVVPIVYPVKMDEPSKYWADKLSDYLIYLYKHWFFLGTLHDAVHDALENPVAYFQLLPPDKSSPHMELIERDAFDVLIDIGVKDVQDKKQCRRVAILFNLPIETIRSDENYNGNRKKVVSDQKFSESDWKDRLMQERFPNGFSSDDYGRATGYEVWELKTNADGKDEVWVTTICQNMELRQEKTKWDRLPIISLKLHGGLLYQPSFVEYLLPMNRSADLFQARMEDAMLKTIQADILAQYGSALSKTTNEVGNIIYWKLQKPEYMKTPQMSPAFMNYINFNFQMMERLGASAVTMGSSPKGIKQYRSVEAVRQQDYAAQKTPMDFMKLALMQLFNLVIYFASQYYLEPVGVKVYQQENYDVFDILGADGIKHNMDLFKQAGNQVLQGNPQAYKQAPVVAHPDNLVEVEFESAQSYTMEGKRQTVFEAVAKGLLDKESAIRMLHMGNTRDIMDALDKEKKQGMADEVMKNGLQSITSGGQNQPSGQGGNPPSPAPSPQPPQGGGNPNPQIQNTPKPQGETPQVQNPRPVLPGIRVGQ